MAGAGPAGERLRECGEVSEVFRSSPEARVVESLASLTGDVAINSVTLAELLAGVWRLPDAQRKEASTRRNKAALEPYRGVARSYRSMIWRPTAMPTCS
jgi:hypothetical protein